MKNLILFQLLAIIIMMLLSSFQTQNRREVTIINKIDNSTMILIPQSSFLYGLKEDDLKDLYKHNSSTFVNSHFLKGKKIKLKSFYIDKNEITNAQFNLFVRSTKYSKATNFNADNAAKYPNLPVTNIGWSDAREYAAWAGKRLPTEEEWEKAGRGDDDENLWPWGKKDSGSRYNGSNQGNYKPVNVGSFPAGQSSYGVMDMAGNVYEMTTGRWFHSACMRGGSFLNSGAYTMCSFRWAAQDTITGASWLGFRCVKDAGN